MFGVSGIAWAVPGLADMQWQSDPWGRLEWVFFALPDGLLWGCGCRDSCFCLCRDSGGVCGS